MCFLHGISIWTFKRWFFLEVSRKQSSNVTCRKLMWKHQFPSSPYFGSIRYTYIYHLCTDNFQMCDIEPDIHWVLLLIFCLMHERWPNLSWFTLHSKKMEKCLVHNGYSIKICWIMEQILSVQLSGIHISDYLMSM